MANPELNSPSVASGWRCRSTPGDRRTSLKELSVDNQLGTSDHHQVFLLDLCGRSKSKAITGPSIWCTLSRYERGKGWRNNRSYVVPSVHSLRWLNLSVCRVILPPFLIHSSACNHKIALSPSHHPSFDFRVVAIVNRATFSLTNAPIRLGPPLLILIRRSSFSLIYTRLQLEDFDYSFKPIVAVHLVSVGRNGSSYLRTFEGIPVPERRATACVVDGVTEGPRMVNR